MNKEKIIAFWFVLVIVVGGLVIIKPTSATHLPVFTEDYESYELFAHPTNTAEYSVSTSGSFSAGVFDYDEDNQGLRFIPADGSSWTSYRWNKKSATHTSTDVCPAHLGSFGGTIRFDNFTEGQVWYWGTALTSGNIGASSWAFIAAKFTATSNETIRVDFDTRPQSGSITSGFLMNINVGAEYEFEIFCSRNGGTHEIREYTTQTSASRNVNWGSIGTTEFTGIRIQREEGGNEPNVLWFKEIHWSAHDPPPPSPPDPLEPTAAIDFDESAIALEASPNGDFVMVWAENVTGGELERGAFLHRGQDLQLLHDNTDSIFGNCQIGEPGATVFSEGWTEINCSDDPVNVNQILTRRLPGTGFTSIQWDGNFGAINQLKSSVSLHPMNLIETSGHQHSVIGFTTPDSVGWKTHNLRLSDGNTVNHTHSIPISGDTSQVCVMKMGDRDRLYYSRTGQSVAGIGAGTSGSPGSLGFHWTAQPVSALPGTSGAISVDCQTTGTYGIRTNTAMVRFGIVNHPFGIVTPTVGTSAGMDSFGVAVSAIIPERDFFIGAYYHAQDDQVKILRIYLNETFEEVAALGVGNGNFRGLKMDLFGQHAWVLSDNELQYYSIWEQTTGDIVDFDADEFVDAVPPDEPTPTAPIVDPFGPGGGAVPPSEDGFIGQTIAFVADAWGLSFAVVGILIAVLIVALFTMAGAGYATGNAAIATVAIMAGLGLIVAFFMGLIPLWVLLVLVFVLIYLVGKLLFGDRDGGD